MGRLNRNVKAGTCGIVAMDSINTSSSAVEVQGDERSLGYGNAGG